MELAELGASAVLVGAVGGEDALRLLDDADASGDGLPRGQ